MKVRRARLDRRWIPAGARSQHGYRRGWLGRRLSGLSWAFSRLSREGRALSSMASAALLFGADLAHGESHLLSLATLSLVTSALVFSRAYRLSGVSVSLQLPQRVAVGDEICFDIELHNEGPRDQHRLRTEPPRLPWDGSFSELPADIERLAAGERRRTSAKARFMARGAHHTGPFRVAALVPLGLAQGRALETAGASFMVVPKVARVSQLTTPRHRRHQPGGVAGASRTGDATDLAGVRPYRPGDPLRDLHARSWARLGAPMVRQYQEEYFTRVGVVVDTDARAGSPAALEAALSLCAGIVARLCRGEELVDVLVTGQHVERLSLGRHLASLERALDVLAAVQPTPEFASGRMLGQLAPHLAQLSSLVLVALDWDEARAAFVSTVEARSVAVVVFVVGGSGALPPRVRRVPLEAIGGGQELVL